MGTIGVLLEREEILEKLRLPGARNPFYDEVFMAALDLPDDKVLPVYCKTPREAKLVGTGVMFRMRELAKSSPKPNFTLRTRRNENTCYIFKMRPYIG